MATTTVPEVTKKVAPITLTANAVAKVKEIMGQQNPVPSGLRVGVVGGGCSGFSYSMQFEIPSTRSLESPLLAKGARNGAPSFVLLSPSKHMTNGLIFR